MRKMILNNLNLNLIDFMPVVIYSLCKCNLYSMQIELDYIWNLSNKKLLTNETIYYLTLMSSACYIIKNLEPNKLIENHSNMCKSQQESMLTLENNRKSRTTVCPLGNHSDLLQTIEII